MSPNNQTAQNVVQLGVTKASYPFSKTLMLGIMGGAYIALGALGSILSNFLIGGGLGRFVGAAIFPTGLMLTILVGGSLFTGDVLGSLALFKGETKVQHYLRGLSAVWIGNFIGAFFIALMSYWADMYNTEEFTQFVAQTAEHNCILVP